MKMLNLEEGLYCIVNTICGFHLHVSRVGESWMTIYKWRGDPKYRSKEEAEKLLEEYRNLSDPVPCVLVKASEIESVKTEF